MRWNLCEIYCYVNKITVNSVKHIHKLHIPQKICPFHYKIIDLCCTLFWAENVSKFTAHKVTIWQWLYSLSLYLFLSFLSLSCHLCCVCVMYVWLLCIFLTDCFSLFFISKLKIYIEFCVLLNIERIYFGLNRCFFTIDYTRFGCFDQGTQSLGSQFGWVQMYPVFVIVQYAL